MTRISGFDFGWWIRIAVLSFACLGLIGCATPGTGGVAPANHGTDNDTPTLRAGSVSEPVQLAMEGIGLLETGRFADATPMFNEALKLDPASSWIQFLNGLAYHLRAAQGDGSLYDLAIEGYRLAIRFDLTNWMARYHLGLLSLDRRQYALAQEQIAEALLFNANDPGMLYSMVVASYNARDPQTAAAVLSRLRAVEPASQRVLRTSAIVMAALDRPEEAQGYIDRYAEGGEETSDAGYLRDRLDDWNGFFARNGDEIRRSLAAETAGPADMVQNSAPATEAKIAESSVPAAEEATRRLHGVQSVPGGTHGGENVAPSVDEIPRDAAAGRDRMVIVDVVIVRTDENITTSKGVNLLSGLTVQFGNGDIPGFRWEDINVDSSSDSFTDLLANNPVSGNILAGTITIPALTYSLNIFNSHADRAEILARPTLVALDGQKSEFFSGVHIFAVSDAAGEGQPKEIETDVGVKLVVTPSLKGEGMVELAVEAERTFLRTPSDDIQFEQKIETTKTHVTATVEMRLGETLILSGLSEKETESIRDGVPGLQDLPGIQYFFSEKKDRDFQRSVLILLTPRAPEYVYHEGGSNRRAHGGKALTELQSRYSDWFKPYPNWASVFHHMQQSNSLYREFRTGDVTMERWANQENLRDRLHQALRFLHY